MTKSQHSPFIPADILLPRKCDMTRWAVVACDQYTSEPGYWAEAAEIVASFPSALNLVLPEIFLEDADVSQRIDSIHNAMRRYRDEDVFDSYPDSFIYLERTLRSGKVRRGLIGMLDLECYDYAPGSVSPVRATEGTVLSRIPPRLRVRKEAVLETPHIMLLIDDPENMVIGAATDAKNTLQTVYDFPLMQDSGLARGFVINNELRDTIIDKLARLADPQRFSDKYGAKDKPMLHIAVGDGNHSLATAKAHYEQLKEDLGVQAASAHPARYALCELVNLHDLSLEFEPIHRVLFKTDPALILKELFHYYPSAVYGQAQGHSFSYCNTKGSGMITVREPSQPLCAGTLQVFLDDFIARNGGKIDYIHGEDVVNRLAGEKDCIGFILPAVEKKELFPAVIFGGVLPRKTFSMGEAHDKRFYIECRKIV